MCEVHSEVKVFKKKYFKFYFIGVKCEVHTKTLHHKTPKKSPEITRGLF
jgi:hypothetical protein